MWCQEVAIGLRDRGHLVEVLTSDYNRHLIKGSDPDWICRDLHLEMEIASFRNSLAFFTSRKRREKENQVLLKKRISAFKPDFILVWGMWNFERSLPALAEKLMPGRVVYYMGDYWPTLPSQFEYYWQSAPRNRMASFPKKILAMFAKPILFREEQPRLVFEHVLFPTDFMRNELERKGIVAEHSRLIHGAVRTSIYTSGGSIEKLQNSNNLHLLFAGRLIPEKGVHTVLEAAGKLVNQFGCRSFHLAIVGEGDKAYLNQLNDIVEQGNIASFVSFLGAVPPAKIPEIYRQADVFLFASIWPEPFGRVLIEAMASGLVVIGTSVGGAAEILNDNDNCLLFPPGDSTVLAEQIMKIIEESNLRQKLSQNGLRNAVEKYDIHKMVREIEAYLMSIAVI